MRNAIRTGALVSTLAILLSALPAAQQGRKAAQATVARTPWGHPDLQGTWNNSTITPLERPAKFGGREFLTAEEARALDEAAAKQYDERPANAAQDVDALTAAIVEVTGVTPERSTGGGTPDGRFIAAIAREVVEFGPLNDSIHKVNECIRVAAIGPLSTIYERTILALLAGAANEPAAKSRD